jgi:hypothetical protein
MQYLNVYKSTLNCQEVCPELMAIADVYVANLVPVPCVVLTLDSYLLRRQLAPASGFSQNPVPDRMPSVGFIRTEKIPVTELMMRPVRFGVIDGTSSELLSGAIATGVRVSPLIGFHMVPSQYPPAQYLVKGR